MAKRYANSDLWDRDWYLSLPGQSQLFVHYIRDHCDCAGIWQPSFKQFEQATGFRIKKEEFLAAVNSDGRIRVLSFESKSRGTLWWLTGFIEDQIGTNIINADGDFQKGVIKQLENNQVPYLLYGYTKRLKEPLRGTESHREPEKKKEKNKEGGMGETMIPEHEKKGHSGTCPGRSASASGSGSDLLILSKRQIEWNSRWAEFLASGPETWMAFSASFSDMDEWKNILKLDEHDRPTLEALKDKANKYRTKTAKTDKQYIKRPGNWLKSGDWRINYQGDSDYERLN